MQAATTPAVDWRAIFGNETILVLATHPGDETACFGQLIARACAAGRPPFVMILADGSGGQAGEAAHPVAMRRERETRAAAAQLGLDDDRLLFAGLFDGAIPRDGPMADAVVAAVDLVMWRNDCHVLCAAASGDADTVAVAALAHAVARRTGLRLVLRDPAGPGSRTLAAASVLPAVLRARAAQSVLRRSDQDTTESYAVSE